MKWTTGRRGFAAFALSLFAAAASAQAYPSKPIHVVVPFAPGGGTDVLTRIVAQQLSEQLKQQVVVENKPGAGGAIGGAMVAKAPADGYTLYVGSNATSMLPGLYKNLDFDPVGDFKPVALIGQSPFLLIVNNKVAARTLPELLSLAKARPGTLTYGSAGNGSVNHVGMELFKSMAGVNLLHVPYRGSSAALADVIGGNLTMMLDTFVSSTQHVKAGTVRALAVTSPKRSSLAPDVPTADEQGVKGYDVTVWYGFVAPKGTPDAIVQKLNAEMQKALSSPAVRERYAKLGAEPVLISPEDFQKMWVAEEKKWTGVIKASNIRVD
jgi:tripartite-type tricarboxylate transporter receptor subunit TctC